MRQNFASPHYSFQCFAHPRLERKTESSVLSLAVNLNRLCLKLSAVSIPYVVVVFFLTLYLKVHLPLIPLDDLFITNFFFCLPPLLNFWRKIVSVFTTKVSVCIWTTINPLSLVILLLLYCVILNYFFIHSSICRLIDRLRPPFTAWWLENFIKCSVWHIFPSCFVILTLAFKQIQT